MSTSPTPKPSPKIADLGALGFPEQVVDTLTKRGFEGRFLSCVAEGASRGEIILIPTFLDGRR